MQAFDTSNCTVEHREMSGEQKATSTVVQPEVTTEQQTRRLPPYNVVILNDEEHTFPYVIEPLDEAIPASAAESRRADLAHSHLGPRDRLYDSQGARRAQTQPGHRLRARPPAQSVQGAATLLRGTRAGRLIGHGNRRPRLQRIRQADLRLLATAHGTLVAILLLLANVSFQERERASACQREEDGHASQGSQRRGTL